MSRYAGLNRKEPHSIFVRFTDEHGAPVHPKDGETWQDPRGVRCYIRAADDGWYTLERFPRNVDWADTDYHSGG